MAVEIAAWQTRCRECDVVYGDAHYSEEEARVHDDAGDGLCGACLALRQEGEPDVGR